MSTIWVRKRSSLYLIHSMTAPQRRAPDESATDFAARVQRLIATRVGVRAVPHDAVLWYKEPERRKALAEWQRRCATELREKFVEQWVIENEGSKEGNGAGIAGQMVGRGGKKRF
jgi:hypothetical protein